LFDVHNGAFRIGCCHTQSYYPASDAEEVAARVETLVTRGDFRSLRLTGLRATLGAIKAEALIASSWALMFSLPGVARNTPASGLHPTTSDVGDET